MADGSVHWWDGRVWTGHLLRDGRPSAERFAGTQSAKPALSFGAVFLGFAALQAVIGTMQAMSATDLWVAVISLLAPACLALAGLLFLTAGIIAFRRERQPAPTRPAVETSEVRPLPGEVVGPGADWYPTGRAETSRWWTGATWAPYTLTRGVPSPSQVMVVAATRAIRAAIVLVIAGAVCLVIGIVVVMLAPTDGVSTPGLIWVLVGAMLLIVGAVVWPTSVFQRRRAALPDFPPEQFPYPAVR